MAGAAVGVDATSVTVAAVTAGADASVFVGPFGMAVASTAAVGIARLGICGRPAHPDRVNVNNNKIMFSFFKARPSCDNKQRTRDLNFQKEIQSRVLEKGYFFLLPAGTVIEPVESIVT
jgi:hypothetical protein